MKKNKTKEQYKEWLNKISNEKRTNPNHSEQAFIEILDYFDIPYVFEKPIIYNEKDKYNGYIFDFYMIIDDKEFDIEIDGISHTDEDSKLKEQKRDMLAKDCNIKVIRLDSYFVLYLRNIFKDEFTKESFLKWIINGCPINLKKDMSEYKEKYEYIKEKYEIAKAKVNTVAEEIKATSKQHNALIKQHNAIADQLDAAVKQYNKMVQAFIELESIDDRQMAAENIMKEILAKQKNTSKVETSNDQEELPF